MLLPKKVKHRKHHRGKMRGTESRGSTLSFGDYGLKSMSRGWVTSRQIEASRRAMTRFIQRGGKIWIRVYPTKPVTMKSGEMPMGKGKGSVDHFVVVIKPGRVMFEIGGVNESIAREALQLAAHKLPVRTKIVAKEE